ncbi:uncharacterized protein LOC143590350 [Bidens hawaiensis]|uniref:uncharacterized protein LOC143590350 n=1 Tax=Bidens hawaiensis TaxID=980011 RepID=UPI00404971E6
MLKNCSDKKDFQWTNEAEAAFLALKQHLAYLPAQAAPQAGEVITVYLSTEREAISSVLIVKRDKVQVLVYYISRVPREAELNCTPNENLILALVHTTKRLRRYFQAHQMKGVTDKPLTYILESLEIAGRLAKWEIGLCEHNILYESRKSIQVQTLANFLVKTQEELMEMNELEEVETAIPLGKWTLYTVEASSIKGFRVGLIITDPQGTEYTYALLFEFPCTNNEVEYEALIAGLHLETVMKIQELSAFVDSRLIANQVNNEFITREPSMLKYKEKVKELIKEFKSCTYSSVQNMEQAS